MSQRRGSRAGPSLADQALQVAVSHSTRRLVELADLAFLSSTPELEAELLRTARGLMQLLEKTGRRPHGKNIVDATPRLRRRAILAALDATPDPRPPPRAA